MGGLGPVLWTLLVCVEFAGSKKQPGLNLSCYQCFKVTREELCAPTQCYPTDRVCVSSAVVLTKSKSLGSQGRGGASRHRPAPPPPALSCLGTPGGVCADPEFFSSFRSTRSSVPPPPTPQELSSGRRIRCDQRDGWAGEGEPGGAPARLPTRPPPPPQRLLWASSDRTFQNKPWRRL
ncbi:lymphocyte antigen 6L isoform X1 [Leopardus geoffroyi]|uniref:lymphocyte antigen 6L isoform X1 n=1 Tax=Leopardus geoffroyi TaxID=46844 RepID=UPI001E25F278|nr:lymphocyte antigen 6L isoform X1 [Leopardus geoffroyi]